MPMTQAFLLRDFIFLSNGDPGWALWEVGAFQVVQW